MQPALFAGLLGERVFVDRNVRRDLQGIGLHCDSARLKRAGSGAAMPAAIQGDKLQG